MSTTTGKAAGEPVAIASADVSMLSFGLSHFITWVFAFEILFFTAYLIIYTLAEVDVVGYLNNWVALLIFFIGGALLCVILAFVGVALYMRSKGIGVDEGDSKKVKQTESLANNGVIIQTIFWTIINVVISGFLWYDWLNRFKDAGSFDANSANTDVSVLDLSAPPAVIAQTAMEIYAYKNQFQISIGVTLISIALLVKAEITLLYPHVIQAFGRIKNITSSFMESRKKYWGDKRS